jgi:transposase-like protein
MITDRGRRRRAALVSQWERSGEPRWVSARRHGLTLSQFHSWKRQVRRDPTKGRMAFAPVQLVTASET